MILVAGATGSLGGKIVNALVDQGDQVRALVRPGSDAAALPRAGFSIVMGDLRDAGSLEAACRDVRTVVSTASATRRDDDTVENVDARGTQALIDAAQKAASSISSSFLLLVHQRTARCPLFVQRVPQKRT